MKKIRFLAGMLVSAGFLYLVFRKADPAEMLRIITSTRVVYLLLVIPELLAAFLVKSYRWKSMFTEYRNIPVSDFFEAAGLGVMSNNLLPFRIGDLIQMFFLGYKSGLRKAVILPTLVLERLCDLFAMGAVLLAGSFFVLLPAGLSKGRLYILMAAIAGTVLLLVLFRKRITGIAGSMLPAGKTRDRVLRIIDDFYAGLKSINDPLVILKILFLTVVLWVLSGLGMYLCMLSVGIKLNAIIALFLMAMTGLSALIPSSPGSIGPLEFVLTAGLSIFGIDQNYAVSFALVYRLMSWLPQVLLGLSILARNKFTVGGITRSGREYA